MAMMKLGWKVLKEEGKIDTCFGMAYVRIVQWK